MQAYKLSILDHEVDLIISDHGLSSINSDDTSVDTEDTDNHSESGDSAYGGINLDYDFGYCNIVHSQIWINSRLDSNLLRSTI